MKNPFKREDPNRDPEKEFRMAVGLLMKAECKKHNRCSECVFGRKEIDCVAVIRECEV